MESLEAQIQEALHVPFLNDLCRLVFAAYRQADDECQGLAWQVAHDYRSDRRRCLIEQGLPVIAKPHKDQGINAGYLGNHTGTSYFAQVNCRNVVLTQSFVDSPETMVRKAEFRKTRARNNTPSLFDNDEPPTADAPLYTLLLHGVEDGKRRRDPYFIDIVVPDQECRRYLARLKLFSICYAVVDSLLAGTHAREEQVPDVAQPELRTKEGRKEA